ncbi:hypothetical protein PILCRDRAFT_810390 [Piloderma croceum F 1598]|uniref:Uncharacterized protein n=1 Tax=Piloderma croceum (strain F 1598) TaxID=765440 RepID=A0A0C3GP53_PILCF|nr:hypothetical protein PILCRDRAFT_810390 [Piloderma croceum F 1598]
MPRGGYNTTTASTRLNRQRLRLRNRREYPSVTRAREVWDGEAEYMLLNSMSKVLY